MTEITNEDRSAWAGTALTAFSAASGMPFAEKTDKVADLATNLVHFLRMECNVSIDEASEIMQKAVRMAAEEVSEDPDFVDDLPPPPRSYGVRLWATFRGSYETQVIATSFEEAVKKASELKHQEFNYEFDDDVEGDETMMVYGPEDGDTGEDDPWAGNGQEVDSRKDGEPFSWDACQLVKDLAKLHPTEFESHVVVQLIKRAKNFCTKED